MATRGPTVGNWYQSKTTGEIFEVVAIDEHMGCIEIQYRSGDIDEVDIEEWAELRVNPAAPADDLETEGYVDEEEDPSDETELWGLHLNEMDLQGFETLDWREPL